MSNTLAFCFSVLINVRFHRCDPISHMKKPFILVSMYRASNQKKTKIQPIKSQLDNYEKIIIMSPVWSALPVPAINSAIDYLPAGKNVELIMVSGGGGKKRIKKK